MKTDDFEDHITIIYCMKLRIFFSHSYNLKQAGGYIAEPQSLEQMEFLTGVAGLEADLTGIRN